MSGTPDDEDPLDDVLNAALTDPALTDLRSFVQQAIDAELAPGRAPGHRARTRGGPPPKNAPLLRFPRSDLDAV